MQGERGLIRWGGLCALVSGLTMMVPLVFYFFVLPAAGSSATHAADAASFLPWMAAHGAPRVALWWIVAASFCVILLGVPMGLRARLAGSTLGRDDLAPTGEPAASPGDPTPTPAAAAAWVAERAGVIGSFAVVLACLMLAAGEPALARAYVGAAPEALPGIVATYEWQRLITALLFDALGFALVGLWIAVSSVAALRLSRLPKALCGLGIAAGALCLCVAVGYLARVGWLGELGLGALAFVAVPAWLIWLGMVLGGTPRDRPSVGGARP